VKKILIAVILVTLVIGFFPVTKALARIGVGVATGKIIVQEKLKPGIIYHLPPLTVVNTGDVPSDYAVTTSYFQNQPQLEPPVGWFIFTPDQFHLNPGKVQVVDIKLNLPINAKPGDYYAFLEAHPIQKAKAGVTVIGIAAAAKLYFTIVPANIFQAIYYKITSFWQLYSPWTNYAAGVVAIIIIVLLIKNFLNVEINLKKKKPKTGEHHHDAGKQADGE
jgi:hypothetical protein